MRYYRINKNSGDNPNGNNEVHSDDCTYYNQLVSYEALGQHSNCHSAVAEAKRRGYSKADGCIICSPSCHKE